MTTPDEFEAARDRVVAAARALLAGELTVLQAAPQIASLRWALDPDQEDPDLLAFAGIDSQTDVIQVVDSLKPWPPELRGEKEREVAEAEAFFRSDALDSARALIARFARPA